MTIKKLLLLTITILIFLAAGGEALSAPGCCSENESYTPAKPQKNEDIAGIQKELARLGFYHGRINGFYTPETANAVSAFQLKMKLPATGIFDAKTRHSLVSIYEGQDIKGSVAPRGKVSIKVDLERKILFIYDDGKTFAVYPVAVGRNNASPVGEWYVKEKIYMPGGPYGSRYMGLSVPWAEYGIHGTDQPWSIGGAHSKGCIRMHNHDVAEIFDWVKAGTPVIIEGIPYSEYYEERPELGRGWRGSETVLIQQKLREKGYYKGTVDGSFDEGTVKALKQFQKDHGFEPNGFVTADIYAALGL